MVSPIVEQVERVSVDDQAILPKKYVHIHIFDLLSNQPLAHSVLFGANKMGMRERTWFQEQKKHHNAWVGILFSVDLHTSYVYAGSEPHPDTPSSQSCASSWYIANITLYNFCHNIFTNVWLHVCHANYTPPPTVSLCTSSDVTQKTIQVRQHMYHGVAWTPCIHAHPPPHPTTGRDLRLSLTSNYPSKNTKLSHSVITHFTLRIYHLESTENRC